MTHPKLDEFVQKLKLAAPGQLKSVILYGSAVTEEFHSKHSDLNLLCVVGTADADLIRALHAPIGWWMKQGLRAPLIFTAEELQRSADVFTIELLDMKARHKILFGENILAGISVSLRHHAIQVERELRIDWLRLRQAMLTAPKKPKAYLELMTASFSSFVALFRHVLIVLGEPAAESKRETIERIAKFADADPAGFFTVLNHREGKREAQEIDVQQTLDRYFKFVDVVTDKFDRRIDT